MSLCTNASRSWSSIIYFLSTLICTDTFSIIRPFFLPRKRTQKPALLFEDYHSVEP